jgi:hypothetical protein
MSPMAGDGSDGVRLSTVFWCHWVIVFIIRVQDRSCLSNSLRLRIPIKTCVSGALAVRHAQQGRQCDCRDDGKTCSCSEAIQVLYNAKFGKKKSTRDQRITPIITDNCRTIIQYLALAVACHWTGHHWRGDVEPASAASEAFPAVPCLDDQQQPSCSGSPIYAGHSLRWSWSGAKDPRGRRPA